MDRGALFVDQKKSLVDRFAGDSRWDEYRFGPGPTGNAQGAYVSKVGFFFKGRYGLSDN
jgi:hypothetical protein